jgi:hypothetical protein
MRTTRVTRSSARRADAWRSFDNRARRKVDAQIRAGERPCCPHCETLLEARPTARVARYLVLDAAGYDLECRACLRFRSIVRHTARSLRLVRMRRLAAAVQAIGAPRGALA